MADIFTSTIYQVWNRMHLATRKSYQQEDITRYIVEDCTVSEFQVEINAHNSVRLADLDPTPRLRWLF
jgi:hypothetical protein